MPYRGKPGLSGQLVEELLPEQTIRVSVEKDPAQGNDYRKIVVEEPGSGSVREEHV